MFLDTVDDEGISDNALKVGEEQEEAAKHVDIEDKTRAEGEMIAVCLGQCA